MTVPDTDRSSLLADFESSVLSSANVADSISFRCKLNEALDARKFEALVVVGCVARKINKNCPKALQIIMMCYELMTAAAGVERGDDE